MAALNFTIFSDKHSYYLLIEDIQKENLFQLRTYLEEILKEKTQLKLKLIELDNQVNFAILLNTFDKTKLEKALENHLEKTKNYPSLTDAFKLKIVRSTREFIVRAGNHDSSSLRTYLADAFPTMIFSISKVHNYTEYFIVSLENKLDLIQAVADNQLADIDIVLPSTKEILSLFKLSKDKGIGENNNFAELNINGLNLLLPLGGPGDLSARRSPSPAAIANLGALDIGGGGGGGGDTGRRPPANIAKKTWLWTSYGMLANLFDYLKKNAAFQQKFETENRVEIKMPRKIIKPTFVLSNTASKIDLFMCNGNIVYANAIALANPITSDLRNLNNAAKAVFQAAGRNYQIDTAQTSTIADIQTLSPGNMFVTKIINVVCPTYTSGMNASLLVEKYTACIELAKSEQYESLALPLFGNGWPLKENFQALITAIDKFQYRNHDANQYHLMIYFIESDRINFLNLLEFLPSANMTVSNYLPNENFRIYDKEKRFLLKWFWTSSNGEKKMLTDAVNKKINEKCFNNERKFQVDINGVKYEFDLDKRIEKSLKTKYTYKIGFEVLNRESVKWFWVDNRLDHEYDKRNNELIETAFLNRQSYVDIKVKTESRENAPVSSNQIQDYRIDFERMEQKNLNTNYVRDIKCKFVYKPIRSRESKIQDNQHRGFSKYVAVGTPDDDDPNYDNNDNDDENDAYIDLKYIDLVDSGFKCYIWFTGYTPEPERAKSSLDRIIRQLSYTEEINNQSISRLDSNDLKKNGFRSLQNHDLRKYGVSIEQSDTAKIILRGPVREDVQRIKQELYQMLLNKQPVFYPAYWEKSAAAANTLQGVCAVYEVAKSTPEWQFVAQNFHTTMPSKHSRIVSIKRLQNEKILKVFNDEKIYLESKNDVIGSNLRFAWHGTSELSPSVIYSSDRCGFDFHYSNEGLWGRGIYFARNASYSHNYAHVTQDGKKTIGQMFLSIVLLGDCVELEPDEDLRMPPFKDDCVTLYDSIKGVTGGSRVYIIYENQKAYPYYLISYELI